MDAPLRSKLASIPRTSQKLNLLIRRIHLYSGLFLVPWVLLYGVTAFLFNHPDALSPSNRQTHILPDKMSSWSETNRLADDILASLGKGDAIRRTSEAKYSRRAFLRFNGETSGSLILDLEKGTGVSRSRPGEGLVEPGPLDGSVELPEAVLNRAALNEMANDLLKQERIPFDEVRTRAVPSLIFDLDYEGRAWRATYNLEKGSLEAKPLTEVTGPHWRTFILRLHMAHVYRDDPARFAWALIVDIMALAMVSWGFTGIYMWWRMKKLRPIGKLVIAASLLIALAMGIGMYAAMSS